MKYRFRILNGRPYYDYKESCKITQGIDLGETVNGGLFKPEKEVEFWIKQIVANHSTWNNGKERSSNPYEERLYIHDRTAESFIEMCKQRLCERTEKRTRDFVWELVDALRSSNEPFLKAVGYCCHPACWWFNGKCPEVKSCHEGVRKLSDSIIQQYREEK